MTRLFTAARLGTFAAAGLLLAACSTPPKTADMTPDPATPLDQYALKVQTKDKPINLRVEAQLSANQRTALDQVAGQANWMDDRPVSVEIITSGDPTAIDAGHRIGDYLVAHDVDDANITMSSQDGQPADVVTVNLVSYRTKKLDCNKTWENLSATRTNKPYANFGCAITANLAAQIADPRDLSRPAAPTPADAGRKATILDKYRHGEVTGAQADEGAKGTISDAIK